MIQLVAHHKILILLPHTVLHLENHNYSPQYEMLLLTIYLVACIIKDKKINQKEVKINNGENRFQISTVVQHYNFRFIRDFPATADETF